MRIVRSVAAGVLTLAASALAADDLPTGLDVYLLGEVHDNARHHQGQAALIDKIAPKAVVFEQLTPEQARIANSMPRDDLTALGEALQWDTTGWPPFRTYAIIFDVLNGAPVVGMATPAQSGREAFMQGAAEVFGPKATDYGLTRPLDPDEQASREQLQFDVHCEAMPKDMMGGMVEAQRFKDAAFSRTILEALETYGSPVAVILGHGHARTDWAVPRYISRVAPDISVYSVGFVEIGTAQDLPFDLRIETDAAERDDPCAAFAKPRT